MGRVKNNKSYFVRFLVLGVCVYLIVTLLGLWNTLNESKATLKALEEQYAAEKNSIEELRAMLDDDSNSAIVEKAARERLGYVFSDEQVFIDISGN